MFRSNPASIIYYCTVHWLLFDVGYVDQEDTPCVDLQYIRDNDMQDIFDVCAKVTTSSPKMDSLGGLRRLIAHSYPSC